MRAALSSAKNSQIDALPGRGGFFRGFVSGALGWLPRTWRRLDEEATLYRGQNPEAARADSSLVLYIFTVVAASLVVQEYWGDPAVFWNIVQFIDDRSTPVEHPWLFGLLGRFKPVSGTLLGQLYRDDMYELWALGYWAVWRVIGFFVIPALAVVCHPRLRKMPLGLSSRGMLSHMWIYGLLFVPVLISVVAVSYTEDFSTYYPFYRHAHRSWFEFAVWESLYIAQFFSLEFFFRGFMIQPLRKHMGASVIFAMMIPYVMIHIGKPMIECFAAVIAGVVLGTLALWTRSIWLGFFIHVSVALAMDLAAIWQTHWR